MEILVPCAESILQGAEQENLRVSAMNVARKDGLSPAQPQPTQLEPPGPASPGNRSNWTLKDGGGLELGLAIALVFILSLAAQ